MNLRTACSIVYPLRDPVLADAARNDREQAQREAYTAEIDRRVNELIESGDLDIIKNEMTSAENDMLNAGLRTFCNVATDLSRDIARSEICAVLRTAAQRVAVWQVQAESELAAEAAALDRHYNRNGGCE